MTPYYNSNLNTLKIFDGSEHVQKTQNSSQVGTGAITGNREEKCNYPDNESEDDPCKNVALHGAPITSHPFVLVPPPLSICPPSIAWKINPHACQIIQREISQNVQERDDSIIY